MTGFEIFIVIGLCYVAIDIVTSVIHRRCVMPGLKCKACRK